MEGVSYSLLVQVCEIARRRTPSPSPAPLPWGVKTGGSPARLRLWDGALRSVAG